MFIQDMFAQLPIIVAARSKAWTIFARSNTEVVSSNPTWGMDVYVRLFRACVVLCVGSGLATGWLPVRGVLPTIYRLRNWKISQGSKDCRAIEREMFSQLLLNEILLQTHFHSQVNSALKRIEVNEIHRWWHRNL
jgi:hypothetical protein